MSKPNRPSIGLILDAQKAVAEIGKSIGPTLPRINDKTSSELVEYALAKAIYDAAKERLNGMRYTLRQSHDLPRERGPRQVVHDDSYATLAAQVISGAPKLDRKKLVALIVERCGVTKAEADAIMRDATTELQDHMRMEVILKRVD